MKFPSYLTITTILAIAAPSGAREVDLLQFAIGNSIEPEPISAFDTPESGKAVSTSLRDHFSERTAEDGPPDPANMLPIWKSLAPPYRTGSNLTSQRLGATRLSCDAGTYVPTWWLSPAAETRRSLYFDTVARIACDHGLPTRLLDAVIAQELGYNSRAISSAGAKGMMQIMPGTARALGLLRPFDPIANMQAGARYLRQQIVRFGRVDLALAAYNAGPERRSLRHGTIPRIPETINYVRTIATNWARLAELGPGQSQSVDRARAAMVAVNSSPYRSVELVSYD